MATINGTDIILFANDERFAALTSNDFNVSANLRDTTNKDSGSYKQLAYGLREASMSASGLILNKNNNILASTENIQVPAWVFNFPYEGAKEIGPTGLKNAPFFENLTLGDSLLQETVSLSAGTYTLSMWFKSDVGKIAIGIDGDSQEFEGNGEWMFIQHSFSASGINEVGFVYMNDMNDAEVAIAMPMLNTGSTALPYQPSSRQWDYFLDALQNKTTLSCYITNQRTINLIGNALVSSVSLSAPLEDNAEISCDLTISGIVEKENIN